jgi:hypothetical protein
VEQADAGKRQLMADEKGAFMGTIISESYLLLIDILKKNAPGVEPSRLSGLLPKDWQDLLALAATQRVRPLLWHRLRQRGLEDAVPINVAEGLRDVTRLNTVHNLRLYGELRHLLSSLKTEGIPLILLKGIYLADAVYENMGLREMHDIDVLARPTDLERITGIITAMGYKPVKVVCADTIIQSQQHLSPMVKKGYASFEIHWNITSPGIYYSIDPEDLWKRAKPVHIAGHDALALSSEDMLLHLCFHTSYQHQFAFGLRPFCDIAETIAHAGPVLDWQITLERAARWGWERGIYLALRLAREMAGADVPMDILEKLRPAEMTKAVLETARIQIFTDKRSAVLMPVAFVELLKGRNFWDKLRIFWQRVFLPRAVISALYSVPMDSARIYSCYPRRFVDVLRRHGHNLKKYRQNDAILKSLVERKSRIANWLAGPAGNRKKL